MNLSLESPLSVWPSQLVGEIVIVVPVKCLGPACDAIVNLFIYEGSLWYTHGKLVASYTQDISFLKDEEKDVLFRHTVVPTDEARRDVGVQVVVNEEVVGSREFDDVYTVSAGGGDMMGSLMAMMGIGMMVMMLGTMMPAITEGAA